MAVLALILSVTAVLVAVGGVADKFFANPERDDRWRLALIALFVRFDETAARLRPAELKSNLLTLLYLTPNYRSFPRPAAVLPVRSDALGREVLPWLFGPRWGHWFTVAAYYDSLFRAGVDAVVLGITYISVLALVPLVIDSERFLRIDDPLVERGTIWCLRDRLRSRDMW